MWPLGLLFFGIFLKFFLYLRLKCKASYLEEFEYHEVIERIKVLYSFFHQVKFVKYSTVIFFYQSRV
jgi:hypothetical protein